MIKKQIIDIDAEFDNVEFDEKQIQHDTQLWKRHANPDWQKSHRKGLDNRNSNPVWKEKIAISNKLKGQDIEWRKKHFKPIISPFGVFESQGSCSDYIFANNLLPTRTTLKSIERLVATKLKQEIDYKYITREEYILLTGKEL